MKQQKTRRNRGVILTLQGWDKLQSAKVRTELEENAQSNFTLEELSDRTQLALHTISKIQGRTEPVDRSSLQSAFAAFGLELCKSDYTQPSPPDDSEILSMTGKKHPMYLYFMVAVKNCYNYF
jgi:hypothetical protein